MSYSTSLGQVVLHLTWSNLRSLCQALQNALSPSSWVRAVLIAGEDLNLCQDFAQLWSEVGHQTLGEFKGHSAAIQVVELAGVEASLLILSSSCNAWIKLEVGSAETATTLPVNAKAEFTRATTPLQAVLIFDGQAIAELIQQPPIAVAISDCSGLTAADLKNNPGVIRRLCLQLLHLTQSEALSAEGALSDSTRRVPDRTESSRPQPAGISVQSLGVPADLVESESLRQLLWEAPVGILYESLDGGILHANSAFCRLIGYNEVELRQLDLRAISYPEDFATEVKIIQQLLQGQAQKQTFNKRFIGADGSLIWTELTLSLVKVGDPEDNCLLAFVTDLSDRKRAELEIQKRRERETLLSDISAKLRSPLELEAILQFAVKRLRQSLDTDRVLAYQLMSDQSGICVAEDVNAAYPAMMGQRFPSDCIPPPYLEAYRLGRLWSIADIEAEDLAECHKTMLERVQVRSMMAVAIQRIDEVTDPHKQTLWGLLTIHHCRSPRKWTSGEQQLVQAVANQMAIALEQAGLIQQLQAYTQELEDRVHQRTESLERSLRFEQLIRNLTEALRQAPDEDQVLKTAVEGLVRTLGVDGCYASLFDDQLRMLEVRYEYFVEGLNVRSRFVGQRLALQEWPVPCRQKLLAGQTSLQMIQADEGIDLQQGIVACACYEGFAAALDNTHLATQLTSPIVDDQGLIGALSVFQRQSRSFASAEIELIEQVASQCAIAIRQARLYRQEHQQRMSAEHFRSFLDKSIDVFVEYDSELRYISINSAGSSLLGFSTSEILGRTNQELLGLSAESIEQLIRQAFTTREKVFVDQEVALPTGIRIFETIYAPITDPTGTPQRVIGVMRDITEFRQQWQLLETHNQQLTTINRIKEEFIATTSHELRTPLTAILGFSNVLLQEFFGPLTSKQKDYLDRIHSSGQHLLDLINDILDLSRIEADRLELEPQLVFIADICESAVSLVRQQAINQGLTLEVEIDPELEYLVTDPRRLKQMLLNLLINAVKFTPSGSVGLKVYQAIPHKSGTQLTSMPRGVGARTTEMIHFLVWDTGIGIDEVNQQQLFSPFSQIDSALSRKHLGTGLGLVITRKLAEIQGGSIKVESSPGKGSRFTLALPLLLSPQILSGSYNSADQPDLSPVTHLIKRFTEVSSPNGEDTPA